MNDKEITRRFFDLEPSFFTPTFETSDNSFLFNKTIGVNLDGRQMENSLENTFCFIPRGTFSKLNVCFGILFQVLKEGLDLVGVRLMYYSKRDPDCLRFHEKSLKSLSKNDEPFDCALVLCIRGHNAIKVWFNAVGPKDPLLARQTDPNSLSALYGGSSRNDILVHCAKTPEIIQSKLCRWFGPSVKKLTTKADVQKIINSYKNEDDVMISILFFCMINVYLFQIGFKTKANFLLSCTCSDVVLMISPLVFTRCLGFLLSSIQDKGFRLKAIERKYLTVKQASVLGK